MAIELFYCHSASDSDEALRAELDKHLTVLKRGRVIEAWHSGEVTAGEEPKTEIERHLNSARIILLLISADFLDKCFDLMERALARRGAGAEVLGVLLRTVDLAPVPLDGIALLPTDSRPITKWPDRDEAFTDVAIGIRRRVERLAAPPPALQRGLESLPDVQLTDRQLPRTATGWYDIGVKLLLEGNHSAGLAALDRAIALDSNFAYAFYNRAMARYFLEDYGHAIGDFDRALELGLSTSLLFRNRANARYQQGDSASALKDYARAIDLDPVNPLAYLNRGLLLEGAGRLESAAADFRNVIRLDTHSDATRTAREHLGRVEAR